MQNLSVCIKELRQCIDERNKLYAQCSLAYIRVQTFDEQIKEKMIELQSLIDRFMQPNQKLENVEANME